VARRVGQEQAGLAHGAIANNDNFQRVHVNLLMKNAGKNAEQQ
jgi:hypothetical protein